MIYVLAACWIMYLGNENLLIFHFNAEDHDLFAAARCRFDHVSTGSQNLLGFHYSAEDHDLSAAADCMFDPASTASQNLLIAHAAAHRVQILRPLGVERKK
jgi:hypothetical protein